MKNIVLITFGSGVYFRYPTDSDMMIAINNLLKERHPSIKVSIQNEHFGDFVKKGQLIDNERMIDHNRNNPTIYLLDGDDTQKGLSSLRSPFFFYSFIQLCKGSRIESSPHNRGINKADLYLLHKQNNGSHKMLERIKALKEQLQTSGCKCEDCIPRSNYSRNWGFWGFDEFISGSQ